ncbi:MAG: hypothetical protein OEY55_01220 [Acidimicrobiia bacterium]|nr:hypothetical protein [Acidimicrobiia bacterium]MDH5420404.1 hypothetical protein [Acidimicrobiia bacterium]MDH5503541.1 hypothetical protein [Acidimicrobiia bacterium]
MDTAFQIAVVALANILGGAVAIPQASRLIRHRRVDGVSTLWAGSSVGINLWWIAYGLGAGDSSWAIIPVGVISTIAYLLISVNLVRFSSRPRGSVVASLIVPAVIGVALPVPAFALGGWPATGITLGTIYGFQLLPAVIAVYRSRDTSGVSVPTWIMAWTEALLWGIYGFGPRDPGILAFATTGLVMSSGVLLGLFIRRSPDNAIPDPDARDELMDPAWPGGY